MKENITKETKMYQVLQINCGSSLFDVGQRHIVAIEQGKENKISNRDILMYNTNRYCICDGFEIFERLVPGDMVIVEKIVENKNGCDYTQITFKEK